MSDTKRFSLERDRDRNTGIYKVYYRVGRRTKRKTMGTRDLAVAEERFKAWLLLGGDKEADDEEAVDLRHTTLTLNDLWQIYEERHLKTVAAPEVVRSVWNNVRQHFGGLTLGEINQDVVDAYVEKRTGGKLGRAARPSTVRKELIQLRAIMNYCAHPKHRPQIVNAADVPKYDMPPPPQPRARWLRMEEMQALLAAAARLRKGKRLSRGERFLWIALETAARKQAILDLTWDRVDFELGVIHFAEEGRVQTKKKRVSVPMSRALRPVLERAYAERKNDLVLDTGWAVWEIVQKIVVEAGLGERQPNGSFKSTGISPHTLRHTAATHMARRGVSLWKISKILGNSYQMVERVYAKWAPDDAAGTVDLISDGELEAAE